MAKPNKKLEIKMVGRPSTGQRTQIRVEQQHLERLEAWAQDHGTTKTAAIREAITQFLAEEEKVMQKQNRKPTRVVLDVNIHIELDKQVDFHMVLNTGEENRVERIREFLIEQANKIADHLQQAEQEKG